jgi:hypothetical protein
VGRLGCDGGSWVYERKKKKREKTRKVYSSVDRAPIACVVTRVHGVKLSGEVVRLTHKKEKEGG